jgi:uncharacterized protein YndB with AHSA1/START domain
MTKSTGTRHGSAVVTRPSDTEMLVTRVFDAPADLVFEAYTTPELVKRWWGFESSEWLVCEIDLRVGGRWRFVTREEAGFEVAFHGEYVEVDRPTRLVSTEVYEGADVPDPEAAAAVNTLTLQEADGVTTMTVHSRVPSKEILDAMLESGMDHGMQVSYDRLEDLVRAGA